MSGDAGIDKQQLYGDFRDHQERKNRLAMKAAHKALDIADDEMQIQANQTHTHTHNGVGAKALALAALAAGLPTAVVAGLLMRPAPAPPGRPADPPAVVAPAGPDAKAKEWDALIEERQPDGSWKLIRRERLKTKE